MQIAAYRDNKTFDNYAVIASFFQLLWSQPGEGVQGNGQPGGSVGRRKECRETDIREGVQGDGQPGGER